MHYNNSSRNDASYLMYITYFVHKNSADVNITKTAFNAAVTFQICRFVLSMHVYFIIQIMVNTFLKIVKSCFTTEEHSILIMGIN